jgi:uncharacterized protein (TIRG00374 family)
VTDKGKKLKRWLFTALKFFFAVGLIVWLVRRGSLDFSLLMHLTHPVYLFLSLAVLFFQLFVNNYRWMLLLKAQEILMNVRQTLPLSLIGLFFNYAMPGGVGGDLVKGFYVMQENPGRRTAAATTVLIDRLVGLFGLVLTSLIAVIFNWDLVSSRAHLLSLAFGVFALTVAFTLFFGVALSRRVYSHHLINRFLNWMPAGKTVRKIYDAVHTFRSYPREFFMALILTAPSSLLTLAFFYLIGHAIGGEDVPFSIYAFAGPLGLIVSALPISPAGVGVGQAAFLVLFNWSLGHDSTLGPSLITAHQLVTFTIGLGGAYFYFRRERPDFKELRA